MPERSAKLHSKKVVLHAAVAALAAPSGVSANISSWRQGPQAPSRMELSIDSDGTGSLQDAYLCAYDAKSVKWRAIVLLHGGTDIPLTAGLGWAEIMVDVAVNDGLAVFATVVGGISVTIAATPVEVSP